MKQVILGVLFVLLSASVVCAQKDAGMKKSAPPKKDKVSAIKLTREYLLAHGFRQIKEDPKIFTTEHVRLADVARTIGFQLSDLRHTVNQSEHSDVRIVDVQGVCVVVASEVRDSKGHVVRHSLDDPNAICTASLSLRKPLLKTDGSPRIRIKSVVIPEDKLKPWQITFEVTATGKKPVAILQRDFHARVTKQATPPLQTGCGVLFPRKTPKVITISPNKPVVLTVRMLSNALRKDFLEPGKYALQIVISVFKRHEQTVDYEWHGEKPLSGKYKYSIK